MYLTCSPQNWRLSSCSKNRFFSVLKKLLQYLVVCAFESPSWYRFLIPVFIMKKLNPWLTILLGRQTWKSQKLDLEEPLLVILYIKEPFFGTSTTLVIRNTPPSPTIIVKGREEKSRLCPRETLQNLPYFIYPKTRNCFFCFSFRATLCFP